LKKDRSGISAGLSGYSPHDTSGAGQAVPVARDGSGKGKKSDGPTKKDKVWVCRGCCCGTKSKHPGIDHRELERTARRGAERARVRYEVTKCLGPCGQGNVVVVRTGGVVRWFRRMNDVSSTAALLDAVAAGDGVPPALDRKLMRSRTGKKP